MKLSVVIIVLACLLSFENCIAQMSKSDMVSFYKFVFLFRCTEQFELEKEWRDEICPWYPDGLDKRSYFEIDSISTLTKEFIWAEIDEVTGLPRDNSGPFPARDCVLKHCLDQYKSKGLDKLAKRFVRRMKNVRPVDFRLY